MEGYFKPEVKKLLLSSNLVIQTGDFIVSVSSSELTQETVRSKDLTGAGKRIRKYTDAWKDILAK